MALPVFDTQDAVPEAFRGEYEEKNGKWHPRADETALREAGKAALDKERKAASDALKRAEAAERKAAEAEAARQADKAGIPEAEQKRWRDEQYAAIRKENDDELKSEREKREGAEQKARTLLLDNKVKAAALKAGVLPDMIDDWWNLNRSAFDLDDAEEPTVKDGKGKPIDRFITDDLRKARPWMYQGTKATGGGTGGVMHAPLSNGKMTLDEFRKLSPAEQMAQARAMEPKA